MTEAIALDHGRQDIRVNYVCLVSDTCSDSAVPAAIEDFHGGHVYTRDKLECAQRAVIERVGMPREESTNALPDAAGIPSLDEFARRYTPALRRYFKKRESQPADVDDLVQEVFARLAGRSSEAAIEQPEAYLLRAAGNVWRDFLRKKQTHAAAAHDEYRDELQALEDRSPEHVVQGQQAVEGVIGALNGLPDRTRQVFVLCRVEGMLQRNIAKRLGVSVSAVEKHMITAIAHLAGRLGRRE